MDYFAKIRKKITIIWFLLYIHSFNFYICCLTTWTKWNHIILYLIESILSNLRVFTQRLMLFFGPFSNNFLKSNRKWLSFFNKKPRNISYIMFYISISILNTKIKSQKIWRKKSIAVQILWKKIGGRDEYTSSSPE